MNTIAAAADDLPIGPRDAADLARWTHTGDAFLPGPIRDSATLKRLEIDGASEAPVLSSEQAGDEPRGTITSPQFTIDRRYVAFRIAGGNYERHTCLNLLVDGTIVRSATGWRSDRLTPDSWDVSAWAGKQAQIQVVDQTGGDWGHINVSHLVQTDTPERLPTAVAPLYREHLRPQFHFTGRQWTMNRLNPREREEGWINDLNGLIYYEGEWHLFAQRWAKCWVHAVSTDLVHWTELPPAFWEEENGSGVQSGTVVVDYANTSSLSPDPAKPPMIAFWSRFDNRSHCISYSLDKGRTWKHYEKNPLFTFPERDPKVFWYAPGKHWVMMMYGQDAYHIFTSTNLLEWTNENNPIPNSFECPDFFQLPVDGDPSKQKWVLIQGNGQYSIGEFDGRKFTEETPRRPCDIGDFYATQSWHNTDSPGGDGRRVQVAWMRFSHFPDMPFSQQVSFPCELSLHSTKDGLRLHRRPIAEIAKLHQAEQSWADRTIDDGQTLPLVPAGRQFHLKAEVSVPTGTRLTFNVRGTPIVITANAVQSGDRSSTVADKVQTVEMLIDTASIETFLNDGEVSLTQFALPRAENGITLRSEGGRATLRSLKLYPLRSAWTTPTDAR